MQLGCCALDYSAQETLPTGVHNGASGATHHGDRRTVGSDDIQSDPRARGERSVGGGTARSPCRRLVQHLNDLDSVPLTKPHAGPVLDHPRPASLDSGGVNGEIAVGSGSEHHRPLPDRYSQWWGNRWRRHQRRAEHRFQQRYFRNDGTSNSSSSPKSSVGDENTSSAGFGTARSRSPPSPEGPVAGVDVLR